MHNLHLEAEGNKIWTDATLNLSQNTKLLEKEKGANEKGK